MGSFGERLRREREMRKISLDEIAAGTKIGTRHLRALEDEDFKKLPGGIFNKGFVRAYARFLGINEEQAVADYLAAAGEPENLTTEVMVDQLVAQHEAEKNVKARSRELETINRNETGIPWRAILGLVVVIAAAAGGWTYYTHYRARVESEKAEQKQSAPGVAPVESPVATMPSASQPETSAKTAAPVQPAPQIPASADGQASTSATSVGSASASLPTQPKQSTAVNSAAPITTVPEAQAFGADGFVVSIHATQRAWISVTADGKHVISTELTPADSKSFRAHTSVSLTTGNAGGVEISFNGKPVPSLGGDGEVRRATFTSEGIQR